MLFMFIIIYIYIFNFSFLLRAKPTRKSDTSDVANSNYYYCYYYIGRKLAEARQTIKAKTMNFITLM
jgi:hypothetical protein